MGKLKFLLYPAVIILGLGIFILLTAAVHYTTTTEFCTSCHSMSFAFEEYKNSRHYKSISGVRAGCPDCHVGRGIRKVLVFKQIIPDLLAELTRPIKDKTEWEKRRPALAKEVREELLCNKSSQCLGCHYPDSIKPDNERKRLAHSRIKSEGKSCIECHKNLVHAEVL